jgi:hypothetical protein
MMLADALLERAEAQARLADLKRRIAENARVQEGDDPAEDPTELLEEADQVIGRLRELIVAINVTNAATRLPDGATITETLARREELGARIRLLTDAAGKAADRFPRFGRAEIRDVAMLDVRDLRLRADRVAQERRDLERQLQQANWTTELLEP